jgi:PAS domain S-box-containing protein
MIEPIHILILEDNPMDAELMIRALKKEGLQFTNTIVDNRNDFIEALNNETFDLILSDNSLPQFDATEAVQIVRKSFPYLPFILVTGTVNEDFVISIMKLGIDDYILKDRLTRLPSAIANAIDSRKNLQKKLQAEKELIKSEAKYRFLIERIRKGIYALDTEWRVLYMNNQAAQLFNCDPEKIIGKIMWEEFPHLKGNKFYLAYQDAMRLQKEVHLEGYSEDYKIFFSVNAYPSNEGIVITFDDITEQKKIEKAYDKSQEEYRDMVARISDAFISLDKNFNYVFLNKQAGELIRKNPEDLIGKNVWEVFPDAIGSNTYHAFNQALKTQKNIRNIDYYPPLDLWQENHIYPSENGLSIFIRDISEEKRKDLAIQKSQEQYKEMVERITDGFYSLDRECRYLFLNDKACDIIQHTREEVLGKTVWDIFPDLVGSAVYKAFMKALDEQVYVQLTEHYEVTGIWKEIHVYPSKEGLSVFVSDISEKMKSEIAAKESEEVRNLIMSSALDAIVCVNHSNQFIFWNRRAEELFGWTFEEVQTKTLETTIIPKKFRHDHTHAMHRYLETGESHVAGKMLELTALNKDGKEFPIELFMIPVKTGSTEFFCAFIRDISTRKKLERKLNEQRRKNEIEKMAVALDAQDNINQILVGTKMMLQMTKSDVEKNKHFLDNCIESLNEVIVENRKLAHEMVTPNVEQESVLTMLQTLVENMFISSTPKVTVSVEENVEEKLNTKQKLTFYRIAQEQCANIIKYANASHVEINVTIKDDKVNLIIKDNGQGMDASKKVNGIGLRNINSRLSIYNGSSEITTAPGEGFTLVVHLPVQQQS